MTRAAFDSAQQALWTRLRAHAFERPDQRLDLLRRLVREQGWTLPEARQAIEEYRRFCFLACLSDQPLTPSEAVDQVWHLHLTHSRDYWEQYCPRVLQRPLHHDPTIGGAAAGRRYQDQYAETLLRYERCFGLPPPRWWPAASERFARPERWRWVDRERYWLLPRPHLRALSRPLAVLLGLLVAPLVAHALPANPLDWTAGPFLRLYGGGLLSLLLLCALLRRWMKDHGAGSSAHSLGALELAYLEGGAARVMDTAVASALADQALSWDEQKQRLSTGASPAGDAHREIVAAVRRKPKPAALIRDLTPMWRRIEQTLVSRGLVLSDGQAWQLRLYSSLPLWAWSGFGLAKILVGLERAKPVGFITVLTIVCTLVALWMLAVRPRNSRAGQQAVRQAKVRHSRILRAPRSQADELALAVALGGTLVLSGTAWAGYHQHRVPPSSSGDGGGGDSNGGGGGGGCGGCGGGD